MKFSRLILIAIASLSLVGCSDTLAKFKADVAAVETKVKQIVTPDNFDTVTALYGTTLATAVTYRNLCASKAINKSCWNIIDRLQPYEATSYNSYIALKSFVKANPTADASSFITALKTAVTNFKNAQLNNGVN